jgi:hypothetical protein
MAAPIHCYTTQARTPQVHTPQVGTNQVGTNQVRITQVRTNQVRTPQVRTPQVGITQVGITQVGITQVGNNFMVLFTPSIPILFVLSKLTYILSIHAFYALSSDWFKPVLICVSRGDNIPMARFRLAPTNKRLAAQFFDTFLEIVHTPDMHLIALYRIYTFTFAMHMKRIIPL